jgi:hypothetical protein
MLRLRVVLDFVADGAAPCAEFELRGYLKAMVQYQHLGVALGSRNLEGLGFVDVWLVAATAEEAPSVNERVVTAGQRDELPTDTGERNDGLERDVKDAGGRNPADPPGNPRIVNDLRSTVRTSREGAGTFLGHSPQPARRAKILPWSRPSPLFSRVCLVPAAEDVVAAKSVRRALPPCDGLSQPG